MKVYIYIYMYNNNKIKKKIRRKMIFASRLSFKFLRIFDDSISIDSRLSLSKCYRLELRITILVSSNRGKLN